MREHIVVALTAALVGCSGSTDPGLCDAGVDITVNRSVIAWTPDCVVHEIDVRDADRNDVVWALRKDGGFSSPLEYGATVSGSELLVGPEDLVVGRSYSVLLSVAAGGRLKIVASGSFVFE